MIFNTADLEFESGLVDDSEGRLCPGLVERNEGSWALAGEHQHENLDKTLDKNR